MRSYLPLSFLRDKIEELQDALFFSMSESVLKMPTCLVHVIQIDAWGQIWFAIPRPVQHIQHFNRVFPGKLDFFRKGKDFYLKILGKAFIVTDPEEINSIVCLDKTIKQQALNAELILIKVSISHADYFEKRHAKPASNKAVLKNIRTLLYRWFLSPRQEYGLSSLKRIPAGGIMNTQNIFSN